MKNTALKVAGLIFLLISLLHLLRLVLRLEVIVGVWVVPQWFSVLGFILPLLLSWWMFKAMR